MAGLLFDHLIGEQDTDPAVSTLNDLEQISVRALIAYVAYSHKVDEALIENIILENFHADCVSSLHEADFNNVTRQLLNLNLKQIIN